MSIRVAMVSVVICLASPLLASPLVGPPEPTPYLPGPVTNGDFEADGGSFTGWECFADSLTPGNSTTVEDIAGNHAARLRATADWCLFPSAPDPGTDVWRYGTAYSYISQEMYIPPNSTTLDFMYWAETVSSDAPGVVMLVVWLWYGTHATQQYLYLDESDPLAWRTVSIPILALNKGTTSLLEIGALVDGWWCEYQGFIPPGEKPTGRNVADLFIDYIAVVPEPGTLALLALGGLALIRRRRAA